jgi:D-sedoheptulose 7-phosphate isomerase
MNEIIKQSIAAHIKTMNLLDEATLSKIDTAALLIIDAFKNNHTVFWCGNGGSASQANHLSAELVGGMYKKKIKPFNSICLNTDIAFITAWSNDDSFDNIFVRQLEGISKKGDVLLSLSTSGESKNIINGAKFAKENNVKTISFTGNSGSSLESYSDINININTSDTQRIQEMHIMIGHIICDIVENAL